VGALRQIRADVAELQEYARYYVSTRVDAAKAIGRQVIFWTVILGIAGVVFLAVIATAAVLLLQGIAGGLADAFDGAPWLGPVLVGALTLAITFAGLFLVRARVEKSALKRKQKEYGDRQTEQERWFGHSVAQRATRAE